MEGIEILSTGEEIICSGFNWITFLIAMGFMVMVIAISSWQAKYFEFCPAIIMFILSLVFSIVVGFAAPPQVGSIPTYKVIIEDSVNFNEFNEKYEIIEQDGKIYTIKEREDSNAP